MAKKKAVKTRKMTWQTKKDVRDFLCMALNRSLGCTTRNELRSAANAMLKPNLAPDQWEHVKAMLDQLTPTLRELLN